MKGNILGIIFTIFSAVLVALIVVFYGRSDRQKPEFRFSALNLTYDSSTSEDDLIDGINAYDAKDGDLTSRIVVEKVVINKANETAVVYYAVADYSGNVAKQSRVFPADIGDLGDYKSDEEFAEQISYPNMPELESTESSLNSTEASEGTDNESATDNSENP